MRLTAIKIDRKLPPKKGVFFFVGRNDILEYSATTKLKKSICKSYVKQILLLYINNNKLQVSLFSMEIVCCQNGKLIQIKYTLYFVRTITEA